MEAGLERPFPESLAYRTTIQYLSAPSLGHRHEDPHETPVYQNPARTSQGPPRLGEVAIRAKLTPSSLVRMDLSVLKFAAW